MIRAVVVTKIVVPLLAAVVSGVTVWELDPNWDFRAKQEGWIPASACPGTPLALRITGPGDSITIPVSDFADISSPISIVLSRALGDHETLGLITTYQSDPNFYIIFPDLYLRKDRTQAKTTAYSLRLPGHPVRGTTAEIWAFVVNDRLAIGDRYASIAQVQALTATVAISSPIHLVLGSY